MEEKIHEFFLCRSAAGNRQLEGHRSLILFLSSVPDLPEAFDRITCGASAQPAQAAKEFTTFFGIGIPAADFLHLKIVPVEEGGELPKILALRFGLEFAKLANFDFKFADSLLKQSSLVVGHRGEEGGGSVGRDRPTDDWTVSHRELSDLPRVMRSPTAMPPVNEGDPDRGGKVSIQHGSDGLCPAMFHVEHSAGSRHYATRATRSYGVRAGGMFHVEQALV